MSNINTAYRTAVSLTVTGLSTAADQSLTTSAVIDNSGNLNVEILVEINVTSGTVSGNKQVLVYAISSVDNANYSDGVTRTNMRLLGAFGLSNSTAMRSPLMAISPAFGGVLPKYTKLVIFNDSGATFSAGTAQYVEEYVTVV